MTAFTHYSGSRRSTGRLSCLMALVSGAALAGSVAAAEPTGLAAKLDAHRLSGPAPLAVMFDATGTTAPTGLDTFREIIYAFDFGDEKGQTWELSGKPRNQQTGGPLAAHVFDTPGTYTVRLRAQGPSGTHSEATVAITVEDPSKAFPGESTVCVSPSSAFAGCPTGALRETHLPRTFAGKRILLNQGETFGTISINRNNDRMIIGSYGDGPKPIVQNVMINSGHLNDRFADDVTIMDLNISDGILHLGSGSRYLIYRNELTRPGGNNSIDIGGALDYLAERNPRIPFTIPREIFIVDNVIRGQVNTSQKPLANLTGQGAYFVIMGNDVSRAEQHTSRIYAMHKGIIAHNALRGHSHSSSGGSIRSVLKMHSTGLQPYSDNWFDTRGRWITSQVVIADNLMGDKDNNGFFTAGVAPQNREPSTREGIEDIIIERNRFIRGPYTNTEMENNGRRITTRGNVRLDGGAPNLSISQPSPALPPEWYGPFYRQ